MPWNHTYRVLDDGERIEGTWRQVFIKNGPTYHLADLTWRQKTHEGDPDSPAPGDTPPSIGEGGTKFAKGGGWVDISEDGYLSNDVPTPVVVYGAEYPSVTHAYWALSTDDPTAAEAIRLAPRASEAYALGVEARRKAGWSDVRLAVMNELVRAKFEQHPDLAARLMATGDARISGAFSLSGRYWQGGPHGRNWLGRILELVRSGLRLRHTDSDAGMWPPDDLPRI